MKENNNSKEKSIVLYNEKHIEENDKSLTVISDEKLIVEQIFVLKYSEKDFIIKIQLIEVDRSLFIRLIAQEKGVIINYNYQTEINEDDFKKQDNGIMRVFNTIPKLNKMILKSFNENKISIKEIKEKKNFLI